MLQDTEAYRKYRRILLAQYRKEGMGWPTYLLVTNPEGDCIIHGELKEECQGEFRSCPHC